MLTSHDPFHFPILTDNPQAKSGGDMSSGGAAARVQSAGATNANNNANNNAGNNGQAGGAKK